MKALITVLLVCSSASANDVRDIRSLAHSNGFKPSQRVILAIASASKRYKVPAKELTAIGILETGLGKNLKVRHNTNGSKDVGIFQINTINLKTCVEYNLDSPEGSAMCAAKLLHNISKKHNDYLGRYHSKTPSKKTSYQNAALKVLANN